MYSSFAPVNATSGSAYNAANFGEVLGGWSRENGYIPAQNVAGLTVKQAKQLEARILEVIPGAEGVRTSALQNILEKSVRELGAIR
ncbi:MAG: hypothetical protein ACKODI_08055 [Acidimicrobiaceae bacterium]